MAQTRTFCPRCKQPVLADINPLFDVNVDPGAKQRFLSGQFNLLHCQNCGYEGQASSYIVYHDPEKEFLLTFFPPELGLPVNEQERLIGPLITQITKNLPPEKRKAYLLRPQSMFTMQTLMEKVLEGEGITHEMIQAQQQRVNLLQRLISSPSDDGKSEILKQEGNLVDESFFALLNQLLQASASGQDEQSVQELSNLQKYLLVNTETGKKLQARAVETEEAIKALEDASKKGLTREKLLNLLLKAKSDVQFNTMVSMVRDGFDYSFFELLASRIEEAKGEEHEKLINLREKLLKLTQEIDAEIEKYTRTAKQQLETVLTSKNIKETTRKILPMINEFFMDVLSTELEAAKKSNNQERSAKLNEVMSVIQEATALPDEFGLIQELLETEDEKSLQSVLKNHSLEIDERLVEIIAKLIEESEKTKQEPKLIQKLRAIQNQISQFLLTKNLK